MAPKRRRTPNSTPKSSPKNPAKTLTSPESEDDEVSFKIDPPLAKRAKLEVQEVSFKTDSEEDEVSFNPGPPEPRRSPNGFILPDPFPPGFVLVDNTKKRWVVGKSIGLGGFGEIYAARTAEESQENFVVKEEPHSNGPLFTEIAFYLKCGTKARVDDWAESKSLDHLGLANFVASGSLIINGKKLRFLVLPRYGTDLQSVIDSSEGGVFSLKTACKLAIQVVRLNKESCKTVY